MRPSGRAPSDRAAVMRHPMRAHALLVLLLGSAVPAVVASAQERAGQTTITAQPLPGGLAAAKRALNEAASDDAAEFLVAVIRRAFQPGVSMADRRRAVLQPLLDHLNNQAPGPDDDEWPLPLTPDLWRARILEPGAPPALLTAILQSSSASLMYCALLSLDDDTREWLAGEPALLGELAQRHAAAFRVAAPGLRVANGRALVPGGPEAVAAWEGLTGASAAMPAEFVRAIVVEGGPPLALLLASSSHLTPARLRFAFALDNRDPAARVGALRRMAGAFRRVTGGWRAEDRPFWQPALDPLLLAADLQADDAARPRLPGSAAFWTAALREENPGAALSATEASALSADTPVDFGWLSEQVFAGSQAVIRTPYQVILFASRRLPGITAANVADALAAVRGAARYPALSGTLERGGVRSVGVYAAAARRAAQIAAIEDETKAAVTATQFQGALAVVARAAERGGVDADDAERLIAALLALDPGSRGEYGGRVAEWLLQVSTGGANLTLSSSSPLDPGDLERELIRLMAGNSAASRPLEWEGTRYRVDFRTPEAARLETLLGDSSPAYITAASGLVRAASALEIRVPAAGEFSELTQRIRALVSSAPCGGDVDWRRSPLDGRCAELASTIVRPSHPRDADAAAALAARLRRHADLLLARGLLTLSYATALGIPGAATISPVEGASRHELGFGTPGIGRAMAWRWPAPGADRVREWHVTGSLLGLDIALAPLSILRLSSRPPATRPSLGEEERGTLAQSMVLINPRSLTAETHDTIVATLLGAREHLRAIGTRAAALTVAEQAGLGGLRRTLFVWRALRDPGQAAQSLSPTERLLVGAGGTPPRDLDAWGASAMPRSGCPCLQFPAEHRPELLAGRWFSGLQASAFADLNLRVGELLAELGIPPSLLAPVLSAATWDFSTSVAVRDFDDRRAWLDFVSALDVDRIEQYLALLTTDGPLVPVGAGSSPE